ncbi:AraC family transcriptional regulator [Tissierella praeacuta]|uniref:helix-turn-helix domain-containing protein n=1 Tax=Tissierella praeacuta TaxID=43131 RepID=UPI00333F0682
MSILSKDKGIYGSEVEMIKESKDCVVYKMKSHDGEGVMTSYQVFPGIELIYNDFHMGNCFHNKRSHANIMEINHCRQGRFECEFLDGEYVYLEEGDLAVNMLSNRTTKSCFPLEHYHGVSIVICLDEARSSISCALDNISINLDSLRDKLCHKDRCFIMRAKDSIEHIFFELYTVPDEVKHGYFKLKVLELLLFLSIVDIEEEREERKYFHKSQVDIIKAIKEYMTQNLEEHNTIEELSTRFKIPITAMKLCFKAVYGTSIYAYMRSYRMQVAAVMLQQGNDSVAVIAGKVGYSNSSKFASAFKDIMGMTPLEYRKTNRLNGALSGNK